jgi:hypothetical protein
MKKQFFMALVGAMLVAGPASADYGMAGCGLGSMLFPASSGFIQVFAATTNTLFGTQTFGITTGTSNCTRSEAGKQSAKAFVETNRTAMAKDIARGQGETIESLAQLAGCKDPAQVGMSLQSHYQTIFPNAGVSDTSVSDSVVDVLVSDTALACGNLG